MSEFIHGDCLLVMQDLPDKSVDLLLTDPPYLFAKGGMKSKLNAGVRAADSKVITEMSDFGESEINAFLNLAIAKLKRANMFIFASRLQVPMYLNWAINHRKNYDILVWDKCNEGIINYGFYNPAVEYIIRIYQDGLFKVDDLAVYQKVQRIRPPRKKVHPAQKPVELLRRLIKVSTRKGDTILDCFAGAGSTAVAAESLGRNFIAIERDPKFAEIAQKRIADTRLWGADE